MSKSKNKKPILASAGWQTDDFGNYLWDAFESFATMGEAESWVNETIKCGNEKGYDVGNFCNQDNRLFDMPNECDAELEFFN